jgi:pimeloyl-ACP methyl ester carboxylesterase
MLTHFRADDDEPIFFAVSGQGSPLVLLHGWTSSLHDWKPFLPGLEPHHRVYRWHARGHGGHALQTTTVPTVARMARDLHQLLTHFDLHEVTLVGHSMGALTLWQYVRDFGCERIARAVTIDQSPRLLTDDEWRWGIYGDFDAARNRRFIHALEADFAEAVLRLVAGGLNRPAADRHARNDAGIAIMRERLRKLAPRPLIDCWTSLTAADYRPMLTGLRVPVLLVHGSASNFYPLDTARYLETQLPEARLSIYEGDDHAPHLWQRERFVRELLTFTRALHRPA